jgi:hypothetical protein
VPRLHTTAPDDFFSKFVYRYGDKQYQTWLGGEFTKVGIDYNYEKSLQDRIYAGIANHFFGYSFARALKLVADKPRLDRIPIFEQTFDRIETRFFLTSFSFLTSPRPDLDARHAAITNSELFMLRVLSSLRAARYLINLGFFSEPLTILRSSLEQLSWCYVVGNRFDKEQLDAPHPSKCIAFFKDRFPAAGRLYGTLSRFSHMEFEAQKHFVTRDADTTGVMQQSTEFKFFGLICYTFLLIAFQYICRDFSEFYAQEYDIRHSLKNIVLPIRHLIGHALLCPELDEDEIAAELSLIYFKIFHK